MDRNASSGSDGVRIWTAPDSPSFADAPAPVTVEWRGRYGHPTSYALLGGSLIDGPTVFEVATDGDLIRRRVGERIRVGLPDAYRPGVLRVQPTGLAVSVAAHGEVGSSIAAFMTATKLLVELLGAGVPADDDDLVQLSRRTRDSVMAELYPDLRTHVTFTDAD